MLTIFDFRKLDWSESRGQSSNIKDPTKKALGEKFYYALGFPRV